MSGQRGGYDQALLDEAPTATRAQRQEGYNVDLLDDPPRRPLSTQPLSPPPPIDTDVENNSQEKFPPTTSTYPQKSAQSFWRTRNGIIIISVIVFLVLGAVIGGAVGGTVGKNASTSTSPRPSTPGLQSIPTSSSTSADTSQTSVAATGTQTGVTPSSAGIGDGSSGSSDSGSGPGGSSRTTINGIVSPTSIDLSVPSANLG